MSAIIEIGDTEWALVEDLFDPPGREGKPARYPRRDVVDAILFLARTGCQWRYLPARYPPGRRSGSSGSAGAAAGSGPRR